MSNDAIGDGSCFSRQLQREKLSDCRERVTLKKMKFESASRSFSLSAFVNRSG